MDSYLLDYFILELCNSLSLLALDLYYFGLFDVCKLLSDAYTVVYGWIYFTQQNQKTLHKLHNSFIAAGITTFKY